MGCCVSTKIKANSEQISSDQIARGDLDEEAPSSRIPLSLRTECEILSSSLNLKCFSFEELRKATRDFRPDSFLGAGGFGGVYKGWIDEETLMPAKPKTGLVIAVKMLNQDGQQGHHEWLTEINYLGQLHHPNLVKLIGYCSEDEQRLLVYEFMTRGSLENHLFKRSSCFKPLPWNLRMKIVLDAAIGLAFLHDQKVKVIYRDFKAANILLDSDYNGKLSDFGLARDGPTTGEKSYVSTRVLGTQGYAAPEYMATGRLTTRSDIYSFGVVLLEIMTGRRVLDPKRPSSEQNLISWARPYLKSKRKIFRIMDTKIQGQYPSSAAVRVGKLAIQCLSVDPRFRPTMREIVAELEEIVREDCAGSHAVGLLFAKQELQEGCQGSKAAADRQDGKKHRRDVNVA